MLDAAPRSALLERRRPATGSRFEMNLRGGAERLGRAAGGDVVATGRRGPEGASPRLAAAAAHRPPQPRRRQRAPACPTPRARRPLQPTAPPRWPPSTSTTTSVSARLSRRFTRSPVFAPCAQRGPRERQSSMRQK
ncbi:unnamed protein product, partial [Iphiclides podalirius]